MSDNKLIRQQIVEGKTPKVYKMRLDKTEKDDDFEIVDAEWFADCDGKDRMEEE